MTGHISQPPCSMDLLMPNPRASSFVMSNPVGMHTQGTCSSAHYGVDACIAHQLHAAAEGPKATHVQASRRALLQHLKKKRGALTPATWLGAQGGGTLCTKRARTRAHTQAHMRVMGCMAACRPCGCTTKQHCAHLHRPECMAYMEACAQPSFASRGEGQTQQPAKNVACAAPCHAHRCTPARIRPSACTSPTG